MAEYITDGGYSFYTSGNTYLGANYGAWSGVTDQQKSNAQEVYRYFHGLGWADGAICGMIGNMQIESSINPGLVESGGRNYLPSGAYASNLQSMTNERMLSFYKAATPSYTGKLNPFGLAIVQWTGPSAASTVPYGQKLVSHAIRRCNNTPWYHGWVQLNRIQWESENNGQWQTKTINGVQWYWNNFIEITDAALAAHVWMVCYERPTFSQTSLERRQQNARQWYTYLVTEPGPGPEPPEPSEGWISGSDFADLALAYDGQYIPYTEKDCIAYVNMVWQDIPVVSTNHWSLPSGTNTFWRRNVSPYPSQTYNTTSPDNQNPTPVLWYKARIDSFLAVNDDIPAGTLLFHQIGEDDNPKIPDQYRGDGIGNFAHVGIYCGNLEVMQSGGRDKASVPGGGVHKTSYPSLDSSKFTEAWNYLAFVCWVTAEEPGPGPGPGPDPDDPDPEPGRHIPEWLLLWYTNKRKEVKKRVIRKY